MTQLGLDPECKWTQGALAQKLGVIQQTINSWISDIRARQRANRNIIIRSKRLACPPSFWRACPPFFRRSWTQEQIAEVVGLSQNRISEIVGNANFGNIDTLLSQGHDMDYMNILNRSGWEITHIIDCPMSLRAVACSSGDPKESSNLCHRIPYFLHRQLTKHSLCPYYISLYPNQL